MDKGSACMTDQYNIEIHRPIRTRRGDSKLIVVVTDGLGKELFRDRADLNEEKSRSRVAKGIAGVTDDNADTIAGRLLDKLGQLPHQLYLSTAGLPQGRNLTPTRLRLEA